ncbi:hypothetical protein K1T71_012140 [Dendrolimus kikuchii]|uniref:Uncharacterized protein n=1 Tax=Dendrolimus kikuchii TaxID=765133 RepID=A0ACC1CL04_9NEOP|nr:hypothetical protein K1T71_012140 [Dendrolimus kikuchii]
MSHIEPSISDFKRNCVAGEWGEWTLCLPENGICGLGKQSRSRKNKSGGYYGDYGVQYRHNQENTSDRCDSDDTRLIQYQDCYVECSDKSL